MLSHNEFAVFYWHTRGFGNIEHIKFLGWAIFNIAEHKTFMHVQKNFEQDTKTDDSL